MSESFSPAHLLRNLAALGMAMLVPGMAGGAVQVMGSTLTVAPNLPQFDCSALPTIVDTSGNFGIVPSNTSDCTWRQSGVYGVLSGDTRFSSVPGDGWITRISVRSGPNPAPLSFVIFRQLSTPGFGPQSQCCFFVSETRPVQLQPNATTTFATNLPVQRNTINGFLAVDLIRISAQAGTGSLPLFFFPGQQNAFALTQFGSVNAGFFYPRLGAVPNDSGGGRREEGLPGVEVLIQWTWCPATDGAAACGVAGLPPGFVGPIGATNNGNGNSNGGGNNNGGAGNGGNGGGNNNGGAGNGGNNGGAGNSGPGLQNSDARVRVGRALVDLRCNGNAVCQGRMELLGSGSSEGQRFGARRFRLLANRNAAVPVILNNRAKRLLRTQGNLPVILRLTPKNGTPFTVTMTLTR